MHAYRIYSVGHSNRTEADFMQLLSGDDLIYARGSQQALHFDSLH